MSSIDLYVCLSLYSVYAFPGLPWLLLLHVKLGKASPPLCSFKMVFATLGSVFLDEFGHAFPPPKAARILFVFGFFKVGSCCSQDDLELTQYFQAGLNL